MFKVTKLVNICFVLATSFTVNYFFIFYIPSDYMFYNKKLEEKGIRYLQDNAI